MAEEKQFENKIRKFLDSIGAWHNKNWGGGLARAGIPDLTCCINGRFVAIETKANNGKPSPLQVRCLNNITCAGGYAVVAYPEDFEELKQNLLMISKGEL